jgi:hypothetical protein
VLALPSSADPSGLVSNSFASRLFQAAINAENPSCGVVTFGAVIVRYLVEELPNQHSTARGYQCWLKNHIRPKWCEYRIDQIKPLAVSANSGALPHDVHSGRIKRAPELVNNHG